MPFMGFKRSKGIYKVQPINKEISVNNNGVNKIIIEEERKTEWGLIYLCALFTFTASVQFTLFFTSLWPFMQILDDSVTVTFFGAIIAMYSLSQIVASPLLGFWSTRIEKLKPPLMICNFLMFLGNFLYCLVELFPMSMSRYVMLASRFTAGIGW
uniref:Major facilitator superfamily (MFS) profile domain-containing protein n=1 Tax=Meloidogyne floridensis TaxID=298350 RepID=A0A915P2X4_9BILA